MNELSLNIVTPEKSIVSAVGAEAVVLPGELGQMTILPGHINLLTNLKLGSFAYKQAGEWKWAYLSGGFAQVSGGKVNVLAETVELAHDINLAEAELALTNATEKLKASKAENANYPALVAEKDLAQARVDAAKKVL